MNMKEKIKALIEQRVIEATKKQMTQKLLLISKMLGRPIVSQTSVVGTKLENPWEEDLIYDPMRVHDADDWDTTDIGYYFDGLSCGINLCVTALIYDGKVYELKTTYNGYLVFVEKDGELKAYAPFPAWEDAVNMFYEAAVQREKARELKMKVEREAENKKRRATFWQTIRSLWGY